MKVKYIMPNGRESKAYLDEEVESDVWVGTNKYTDSPVRVRWDEDGEQWIEVTEA